MFPRFEKLNDAEKASNLTLLGEFGSGPILGLDAAQSPENALAVKVRSVDVVRTLP